MGGTVAARCRRTASAAGRRSLPGAGELRGGPGQLVLRPRVAHWRFAAAAGRDPVPGGIRAVGHWEVVAAAGWAAGRGAPRPAHGGPRSGQPLERTARRDP